ncbi:MAG TPA: aminotransferase class V-fold PLP-dependent enzyme [Actinomycetota bacterium]|nr:aminotransferase class V-fold PLP-dependent enzyme [Actinomycetota bacterium]
MPELSCQREKFEIPNGITYLNAAYMGPLSRASIAAGIAGLERKVRPWEVTAPDFFEPVEEVRTLIAELIDADRDGVALLPSVSYGIAVAAQNLPFATGSRIVVLAEEFPSNYYAWRELASRESGDLVTVQRPAGGDWTSATLERIDERTSIVAVANCHWTDGGLLDLVRIGQRAREVGAALVVDGTQSIGAMPFDVAAVQPDFLVCAAYKWMLGPYSSAFVWCAPAHRSGRPLEFSWMTRKGSDDFPHLVEYQDEYRPGARRYDVGETSNFALLPVLRSALSQTLEWGIENIASYIAALGDRTAQAAESIGLGVAARHLRAPHLIGVRLGGADPGVVAKAMAEAGIYVSVRGDAVRVAPHVYNDADDVDRLFEVLRSTL